MLSCPSIRLLFMHRDPSRAAGGRIYIPSSIWYSVRIQYMYMVIQNKITPLSLFPSPNSPFAFASSLPCVPVSLPPTKSGPDRRHSGQIRWCWAAHRPDLVVFGDAQARSGSAQARSRDAGRRSCQIQGSSSVAVGRASSSSRSPVGRGRSGDLPGCKDLAARVVDGRAAAELLRGEGLRSCGG